MVKLSLITTNSNEEKFQKVFIQSLKFSPSRVPGRIGWETSGEVTHYNLTVTFFYHLSLIIRNRCRGDFSLDSLKR